MADPNTPNFNPGGIADRIDNRDFLWGEVGFGAEPFDWSTEFDIEKKLGFVIPPKDQGPSFSCGGQAWSYLAGILEAVQEKKYTERSAKYVYSQVYAPGGGSRGRDCAQIFVNQGVARETSLSSYENSGDPTEAFMERSGDIVDSMRQDALSDKSFSYTQTIPSPVASNIDNVAQAIRDNNGVILGLDGENNGTWGTAFPLPPVNTEWRHWIYAGKAKMINGTKYIGLLNSWGNVGENGWQWIHEPYFTSGHVWSGWTHVLNLNPIPPSFKAKFVSNLSFGQSGVDIQNLQQALQIDGEFPKTVAPTGFYGGITASAVLKFRTKYNIDSSSDPLGHSVGPLTRAELNKLFN